MAVPARYYCVISRRWMYAFLPSCSCCIVTTANLKACLPFSPPTTTPIIATIYPNPIIATTRLAYPKHSTSKQGAPKGVSHLHKQRSKTKKVHGKGKRASNACVGTCRRAWLELQRRVYCSVYATSYHYPLFFWLISMDPEVRWYL
jgi:hypothetical protein